MSAGGASAWGKPRSDAAAARVHASSATSASSPKAKAPAKTPVNIAALAARNLGGFVPNKIFVGGVPVTCTEEQFRSYFEPYGAISKVELHALRGFGYITYESVDAVDACLEKYEEHYFGKKWVEVKRSIPRELIDSYEREQRRLQAEHNGTAAEVSPIDRPSAPPMVVAKGPGLPKAESPVAAGSPPASHASSAAPSTAAPRSAPWKAAAWKGGGAGEPSGTVMVSRIAQLKEMGFSEEVAKRVLAECVWDVNTAIDRLLASGEIGNSSPTKGPEPSSPARPRWGPSEPLSASHNGAPPPAIAPSPAPAVGRPWPQPAAAPEPRGCWGAGAPSICSASAAPKAEGAPRAAQPPEASGSPSALEPPALGPPPPPAAVAAAAAAPPAEEPAAEPVAEAAAEPEVAAEVPAVSESEEQLLQQATVVPEGPPVPDGVVAEGRPEVDEKGAEGVASGVDGTVATPTSAAPPTRKQIQRVERGWAAEDSSQMTVTEGEFVETWIDTCTEHGWIHAEKHSGGLQVGWLPACVLQQLPENQRWMRARQQWQAMDESQCSVEEGAAVIVWVNSRTQEGWTYVESPQDGSIRPGWLPAFCLEWTEV